MGNNYEKIIPLLCSLNGHKILIRGNHDTEHRIHLFMENKIFEKWIWADCFKIGKKIFYLSHYYTETSNHEDKNPPINLYGHIHSNFIYTSDRPCGFHVGVDATKLSPISIKDILNIEKGNI